MKKFPNRSVQALAEKTGFQRSYLSDVLATRIRPKRLRAIKLEQAAKELGRAIPAPLWIFGSREDLRAAFLGK